jgi:cation diffusion facilitator CzcD-associated flavoprotein CzcO
MSTMQQEAPTGSAQKQTDFDAVVIGAGFAGLYMVYKLRELGLSVRALESGSEVGGTWYWNSYPGARTDSESHYYCYSFSKELLEEWKWQERYPSQPEVYSYLKHVADKFDLRRDIDFGRRVTSAVWHENACVWNISTDTGDTYRSRYLISAMGILSAPHVPALKGLETFRGEHYVTARWPKEGVDLTGKRIGVIGTGATGIQFVPIAAQSAEQVCVFQRTANYVVEAQNRVLDDKARSEIAKNYDDIWQRVREHSFAMPFESPNRLAAQTAPEDLQRIYEEGWQKGGFRFLFETFDDLVVDEKANETAAEFVRSKIREIVKDPKVAEMLSPRDYPLGGKRLPAGHSYFEAFNRDNVTLVDIKASPIEEVTETGIRTATDDYELDMIVFATGFDAFTGALTRVDIRGVDGASLKDKWQDGPRTLFGLGSHGFPNLFAIGGPQTPFANNPPCTERQVEWIANAIRFLGDHGLKRMEPTLDAEGRWVAHTAEVANMTLLPQGVKVGSWFTGANIPGKKPVIQVYFGGANNFNALLAECASKGYEGYDLGS